MRARAHTRTATHPFTHTQEFYLAPTRGGPRMYINLEDYISKSSGQPNTQFQTVIHLFRGKRCCCWCCC